MALVAFLSCLIIFPLHVEACGWWGDASHDDNDDSIVVDSEENPIPDEVDMIIDPEAQTNLGNRYRTGDGVDRDYAKAVRWYLRAAKQGFAGAQNNLAVMYEQGLGVPQDKPEAAKWFRKAAEQNDAYAQHSLGRMYRDGEGVPQNPAEAAKWISRAAAQRHPGAFRDMGEIYWKGLGVSKNAIQACMWWKLGVLYGDRESEKLLRIATEKMTSSSVEEAENMAQDWMRNNE